MLAGFGPRIYALDSLRAAMMLLGIGLHACLSYVHFNSGPLWPVKDPGTSVTLGWFVLFVHSFRMAVFFLISGFFARLVYDKLGPGGFVRHRMRRIVVPLVIATPLVHVTVTAGGLYAAAKDKSTFWAELHRYYASGDAVERLAFVHLWFLYYLIFFYAFVLAVAWMIKRLRMNVHWDRLETWFRKGIRSPWRVAVFAAPAAPALYATAGLFYVPDTWLPSPAGLVQYGVYFGIGWLLYRQADLLVAFPRRACANLVLGALLYGVYAARLTGVNLLVACSIAAVSTSFSACGVIGLSVRWLNAPNRVIRYLADSSYWLYLVHVPLVLWLSAVLVPFGLAPVFKVAMILGISVPVMLFVYQECVRYTLVGEFLNGSRQRSGMRWYERRVVRAG